MWCVGMLSSEDDGRQISRHLSRFFRQSVHDNPLGFCHANMTTEGAQGKLRVTGSDNNISKLSSRIRFVPVSYALPFFSHLRPHMVQGRSGWMETLFGFSL